VADRSTSSHLDERGEARMVDVSKKAPTRRVARATGRIVTGAAALDALASGELAKGDALAVARVAGIQAAKETSRLLPLCHPLLLDHVAVDLTADPGLPGVRAGAEVVVTARTGLKSIDRGMTIEEIRLERKSGGRSGTWSREPSA